MFARSAGFCYGGTCLNVTSLKATISGNLFITNNDNGFLVLSHYITHILGGMSQKHIRIYLRSLLLVLLKILMHLINQ